MNDTSLKALKTVVERAVRPVQATTTRKRRMREELLAHLLAVTEEETERLGDEQAALERARERFGDPKDVSRQLQETVPRWDRLYFFLDKWMSYKPGDSIPRFVLKQSAFMFPTLVALMLLAMPVLVVRGRIHEIGIALQVVVTMAAAMVVFSSGFILLSVRTAHLLSQPDTRGSVRRAWLYSLTSLPLFPALTLLIYGTLGLDVSASYAHVRLACCFAPATPLLFFLLARQEAKEMQYRQEWASLEAGE